MSEVLMMDQKKLLHWGLKELWPSYQAWKERVRVTLGALTSTAVGVETRAGMGDGGKIT